MGLLMHDIKHSMLFFFVSSVTLCGAGSALTWNKTYSSNALTFTIASPRLVKNWSLKNIVWAKLVECFQHVYAAHCLGLLFLNSISQRSLPGWSVENRAMLLQQARCKWTTKKVWSLWQDNHTHLDTTIAAMQRLDKNTSGLNLIFYYHWVQ